MSKKALQPARKSGKEALQAAEQRFPCSLWRRARGSSLYPCSPRRNTSETTEKISQWEVSLYTCYSLHCTSEHWVVLETEQRPTWALGVKLCSLLSYSAKESEISEILAVLAFSKVLEIHSRLQTQVMS